MSDDRVKVSGAWIFVAHSYRDFSKVRKVRNALEDMGHYPILFFLKCVREDDEIDALVKREIRARTFFLLCDSTNARESKWVQKELAFIKGLSDKVSVTVGLDDEWETQYSALQTISRKVTVYLSWTSDDVELVEPIASGLRALDYYVSGSSHSLAAGQWIEDCKIGIEDAIDRGFFLMFLSPRSLARVEGFHFYELRYAQQLAANKDPRAPVIVPVVVDDYQRTLAGLQSAGLGHVQALDLSQGNTQEKLERLRACLR